MPALILNHKASSLALIASLGCLFSLSSFAQGSNVTSATAKGSFSVQMAPQSQLGETDGVSISRLSLSKSYEGDLVATGEGEMLTARPQVQGSAGYVAIEKVFGTLNGKSGSFVLQHSGIMGHGVQSLTITVVPDTGTGGLTGISGSLKINVADGQHFYELDYSLPQ